jgi:hypothetical protein
MLRFLADRRDGVEPLPDLTTRRLLVRSIDAVRQVDRLARSDDPLLAGPAPKNGSRRRAWLAVRQRRISPLERELDEILHAVHQGHVPELRGEAWFARFVSCLMACERHFEQRGRLGQVQASNRDVVGEQWDRVLLATDALASLVAVTPADIE